jgi:hypothetical protein
MKIKVAIDSADFTKETVYNANERILDPPGTVKTYIIVNDKGISQELPASAVTVAE